MQKQLESSNF